MLQQLSVVEVVGGVMDVLKKNIPDVPVKDSMPKDSITPMINVSFGGIEPADTKTMFRTKYQILLYGFADGSHGSVAIFNLIQQIQEAMTDEPALPDGCELIGSFPKGVAAIQDQSDGSKMCVLTYELTISYGFKFKI
jgi:hypothetical protein